MIRHINILTDLLFTETLGLNMLLCYCVFKKVTLSNIYVNMLLCL